MKNFKLGYDEAAKIVNGAYAEMLPLEEKIEIMKKMKGIMKNLGENLIAQDLGKRLEVLEFRAENLNELILSTLDKNEKIDKEFTIYLNAFKKVEYKGEKLQYYN